MRRILEKIEVEMNQWEPKLEIELVWVESRFVPCAATTYTGSVIYYEMERSVKTKEKLTFETFEEMKKQIEFYQEYIGKAFP